MDRRPEDPGTYRVFPEHAQPCVWMTAGFLSYKLCDRDFDCEHCPLDAAIHGGHPAPARDEETPQPDWGIRDGIAHHPVYGWVADDGLGRVRWGIDGFTARLLDHLTEVVLPAAGAELAHGNVACWVLDDGELVPLRSPVSGKVTKTNPALSRDPALVIHEPYGAGWLIEMECRGGAAGTPGIAGAAERRARIARQVQRLHRGAMAYLRTEPGVGPTAQDGGQRLSDLRRMLGRDRYHRLVFPLLR